MRKCVQEAIYGSWLSLKNKYLPCYILMIIGKTASVIRITEKFIYIEYRLLRFGIR